MRTTFFTTTVLGLMLCSILYAQNSGNAIQFASASSQYVNVPYTSELRPANTITLEAWINTDWQTIGQVAMVGNTEIGGYEFDVNYVSGSYAIMFEVHRNGSYATPSIPCSMLSAGWHHFAGTYDGRFARLYVDGNLAATNDAGAVYPIHYSTSNNDLIIGAEAYQGSTPYGAYFTGQLDEIRIWNYVRSQTELLDHMHTSLAGNESGLLVYYTMDETAGSTSITDHTGNGFTGFVHGAVFVTSNVSLPVDLVSFTVQQRSSTAELKWKTATEVNNHGFEIERRAMDRWNTAAFVEGSGTANIPREYSYSDKNLQPGKYSYRLKQIDRDGKFSYSQEIDAVIVSDPQTFELQQNYPNPFNPSTTVTFNQPVSGHVSLKVYDILGRETSILLDGMMQAGTHTVHFDASSIASGIYLYRLTSGTVSLTKTMNLLK